MRSLEGKFVGVKKASKRKKKVEERGDDVEAFPFHSPRFTTPSYTANSNSFQ